MRNLVLSVNEYVYIRTILIVGTTLFLSYITLVFGILLPKKIGMNRPEEVAYDAVEIIELLTFFFKPFVKVLTYLTNFVMIIFHIKEHKNDKISESELKEIIIFGKQEGAIKHLFLSTHCSSYTYTMKFPSTSPLKIIKGFNH